MKKKKNIFKKLVGIERGNKKWKVANSPASEAEKWIYHILPADAEVPSIEEERKDKPYMVIIGVSAVLIAVLVIRLFSLQIVNGENSMKLAEGNRVRENVIRSPRGVIYDSKMTPLVKNVPNYDLVIIPANLPLEIEERNNVIKKLSAIIKITESDLNNKIKEKGEHSAQPVLISKNIDKDTSIIIASQIKDLAGVRIEVNPIREYLDNGLLSHALGYVGRISESELEVNQDYVLNDYIGKLGLEESYERILRGVAGRERVEVDSTGKQEKVLGQTEPIAGDNLKLAIDFELQKKMVEALQKGMNQAKVQNAAAVAMNPQTGEILSIVSLPTYDNNLFAKGISDKDYQKLLEDKNKPMVFRAIAGEYPSGSSIKPFIAAGALEEGTITENTTVNSTGGLKVGEFSFPDWKSGGHGITNVVKAIAESVNTFFYAIGGGHQNIKGMGPETIKKYLDKFGFSKETKIDVQGESKGSIPDSEWKQRVKGEPWYLGDSYLMSIGQGDVLVTPLQIAVATSAIANGGKLITPHLVKSILDSTGKEKSTNVPQIINSQVISKKNVEIIRKGMRQTVVAGSARSLKTLPIEAAGKTGTAQYGPNNSKTHAWFTAFAPYNNPTFEITIIVEGAGGGDKYAVPVAKEVLEYYFKR
jgi:penicillin-binding protein 2